VAESADYRAASTLTTRQKKRKKNSLPRKVFTMKPGKSVTVFVK